MMVFIGIDNGLGGGVVAIDNNQELVEKFVMPTIKNKGKNDFDVNGIVKIFKIMVDIYGKENLRVVLEQSHVRPISGKRASFTTGFCYGLMQGILETYKISYEIVAPREWQRLVLKGLGKDTKAASALFCQRKWPDNMWTKTSKSKKAHTGLTDAACMAVYCYKQYR